MSKKFYVTTPIYYVTARPHLGTTYSTILADILNRWHKLKGQHTFFLTGTDEHGQKVAEAAEKAKQSPQDFVDSFIPVYKDMWHRYEIKYDTFIRTTEAEHKKAVAYAIKKLIERGDIYKAEYTGWYCRPCETFVPEHNEPGAPICPECKRATVRMSEPSYFFKMSAYQDKLLRFYDDHADFIYPKERLAEVVSFVRGGLKDLSISRSSIRWGIPFPGDPEQVIYVWVDALLNYVSALGYGDPARADNVKKWWPADVHILGKDIVRFHAVHWPALLMALELPLPHHLLVHGWLLVNEQKMSKSFGNAIDPEPLCKLYGADGVRYYLASRLAITQDSDFSIADLEHTIDKDLANELGNLLNRITTLAAKYDSTALEPRKNFSPSSQKLLAMATTTIAHVNELMDSCAFHLAYAEVKRLTAATNAYVHENAPWKQAQDNRDAFIETLTVASSLLYCIGVLLSPVMPSKCAQLLESIGLQISDGDTVDTLGTAMTHMSFKLTAAAPLFEKVEGTWAAAHPQQAAEPNPSAPTIEPVDITDFAKLQLTVGTVVEAEEVEKSDKLLKLRIDFGPMGTRQILAGIRQYIKLADLLNRQIVCITNLKPRTMMGIESQGMVLCATADGKPVPVTPVAPVPNGTTLR